MASLLPRSATLDDGRRGRRRPCCSTGAEAQHAVTVRRVRVGERVAVGDGRGLVVGATVTSSAGGDASSSSRSIARDGAAPAPELVLVQALAKGDRDELAVQAATELGVTT